MNWGLGHATRCIPIIEQLQHWGYEVIIASDGPALQLLRSEFPNNPYFTLPSYGADYKTKYLALNIAMQIPTMWRAVKKEQRLLSEMIKKFNPHGLISDNRFGLYSRKIPTAIISHQIEIPIRIPILHQIGNAINHTFFQKFQEIWVPDLPGEPNLSGKMSHGTALDEQLKYLGPLSRMKPMPSAEQAHDILVVLSGTEPQRTILEHILLRQLADLPYRVLFVQGIPGTVQRIKCSPKLELVSFLGSKAINQAMEKASLVMSRSGYTTIMDLAKLGKKAFLVPTPGQKEQEELASYFLEKNIFHSCHQNEINLYRDIPLAMNATGIQLSEMDFNLMTNVLKNWLEKNNLWLDQVNPELENLKVTA